VRLPIENPLTTPEIGAILMTARTGAGERNLGGSLALPTIAAAVIGGVSLRGGEGGVDLARRRIPPACRFRAHNHRQSRSGRYSAPRARDHKFRPPETTVVFLKGA